MLHITKKTENTHKKTFAAEVFMSLMFFSVFHVAATQASDITADTVIKLVNKARESANEAVLAKNDLLQKAAQNKAQDMIDNNYFAHISPEGKSPWLWIENTGYDYRYAGENLAINYTNAEEQQQAWMDSPLHRKNILNPDYQEIGVAVKQGVIDGHQTTIAVQMFGTRVPEAPAVNVAAAKPESKPSVAGADSASLGQNISAAKFSGKAELSALYKDNKPAFIGWLAAFAIAIIIFIIDVSALIHKKHSQLFVLKETRNRHA